MEIKLNLRLQTILNLIHYMENLEQESLLLLLVGLLLTPLIIFSFWSLSVAVLCQLFWLGVKAGLMLFTVCGFYLSFLTFLKKRPFGSSIMPKCTLTDIILSVLFQAGLQIPLPIWNALMSFTQFWDDGGAGGFRKERQSRNRRYPDRKPMNEVQIEQNIQQTCGTGMNNEDGVGEDFELVSPECISKSGIEDTWCPSPTSSEFGFPSSSTAATPTTAAGGPASRTRRRARKNSSSKSK